MLSADEADRIAARLLGGRHAATGGTLLAHARRVAAGVRDEPPSAVAAEAQRAIAAALLHDVLEKADVTADDLRRLTGDERVVHLVEILTKRVGESDRSYLTRCASDPTALAIKRMDLLDKLSDDDASTTSDDVAHLRRAARRRIFLLDQISRATTQGSLQARAGSDARGECSGDEDEERNVHQERKVQEERIGGPLGIAPS